jgi:hypothetical protein
MSCCLTDALVCCAKAHVRSFIEHTQKFITCKHSLHMGSVFTAGVVIFSGFSGHSGPVMKKIFMLLYVII